MKRTSNYRLFEAKIEQRHNHVKATFEMIDLGLLYTSWAKSHGGIFHNQHRYLPQLLEMYGIIDCKPLSYPMDLQS